MRIDKFLKNARIIKRRTIAKEACDKGRIKVNGKQAKAGTIVAVGDEVEITFGNAVQKIKIEHLKEHVKKEDAESMYTYLDESEL